MTTDIYQFPTKEMRDLAYETEMANGTKGVTKFTDQVNNKVVWVLAVPVGITKLPHGKKSNNKEIIAENANSDLTVNEESANMTNEGGPDVRG